MADQGWNKSNRWSWAASLLFSLLLLGGTGCENGNGPLPPLRFGQIGEIRVGIVSHPWGGEGELQQILTWGSTGEWVLREVISYRGLEGDETVRRSEGDPVAYASAYASLITQLNEVAGVELFVDELPQGLPEPCPLNWTEVSFRIWDEVKEEEATWVRCAQGTLASIKTSDAFPDLAAGRVIQAAILVRDYTQGADFASAYVGSVPFGTLDRSEDSGARLTAPRTFVSVPKGNPASPTGWEAFWQDHKNSFFAVPPSVDWSREMVIVAAVGERGEAGDSVEVRRILDTGEGRQVVLFERQPGDFCSPASRDHFPIHIVVAPRTSDTVRFSEVVKERVPCGI